MEASNAVNGITLTEGLGIVRQCLTWILVSIGYYRIFIKCGINGFWGFVPFAREYNISLCADREKDGRVFTILSFFYFFLFLPSMYFTPATQYTVGIIALFMRIAFLAVMIARLIYIIRIFIGLCQMFERRKRWVWGFIFLDGITTLIWGFNESFKPKKQVMLADKEGAARVTGANADNLDTGLTINIADRTVIDFFQKKTLLKDIHLNIPSGHMVLLLGGSGAGKTTFVNAVTGYEKANASILLKDNDLYKEYSKLKYDVGFVPQQDLMRGNDTVLRTLSDAATLRLPADISYALEKERVQKTLEEFGLVAIKASLVEKLSGGQRKRLSIAMEYISDPSLFILDEPDSGLDGVVARGLFEKLRSIADSGKIVVVITHTPDRVIDLFDDVIVLAKDAARTGRLAYYGPVDKAYDFFGKKSMEEILLSVNQKEEGGEGRADEFVEKYSGLFLNDNNTDPNRKAG